MIKVYGIKNCNKIRDTRKWLENNDIEYEFIDLKKVPLQRDELKEFVQKIGLDSLVNRQGMKWRQLGLSKSEPGDDELFELLLKHQTMIRRPLMAHGEALLVGYDEDAFSDFIS